MTVLGENFGTLIICLILALSVFLVIKKLIKDKKNGKCKCGCACASCSMSETCHADKKE